MNLFFSFVVSVAISITLTPVLMRYAGFLNMLDEPGERKIHITAIPRCGGLALAIGAVISILIFLPFKHELYSLIIGSTVIILFGLLDDRFELNYKWKFLGQFIAVFGVMYGGIYLTYLPFAGLESVSMYIALPLTVFFVIGVTNAVNLSDGLDGLAAGIMLMTFSVIAYMAINVGGVTIAIIALAVAGGIIGFLWFNTHPAIVFMGDTGSQFIGFMAVFLAIYLTQNVNQTLNPALPLLLLGLPILDTLTVMMRRIRAGRSPFSPDKTHLHHRLMEHGFSHAESVASIYLFHSLFLASALVFKHASDIVVIGAYLLISTSILIFFYLAKVTGWSLHPAKHGINRRGNSFWRKDALFQFCRHYINFSLAIFLVAQLLCLKGRIADLSNNTYLVIVCSLILFLMLPRTYQNIWVRFSIYIAAIFANIMGQEFPEMEMHTHWLVDVFLFALIIVVSVAIRITRKTKFCMTTQDVLLVLLVIASILLIDINLIEHVTFRLFCLVYALEYLLHRNIYKFRLSRYTAAVSGVLIVTITLPTLL